MRRNIAVLTYTVSHRKTYDTLSLLKARGYKDVTVFAQPMTYVKKLQPLIAHRPGMNFSIPEVDKLCENLGYKFIEGEFGVTVSGNYDNHIFLLCGAGLLPEDFVFSHRIINSHPGYIPLARGLVAYKWSVYNNLPIGVTTHFLGAYVDAGEVIERRSIKVEEFDTFHSIAQRIYENEIDMLVGAIDFADKDHNFIIPAKDSVPFKRMPEELERELFDRFDMLKKSD